MSSAEEIPSLDKEKIVLTDDHKWDQSSRAEAILQHILTEEAVASEFRDERHMTVAEAMAARPVIDQDTGRNSARVLIVTTDESLLLEGSSIRTTYMELGKQLDELHVMCLIAREGKETFDRVSANVWFYQVRAKNWWNLPWAARRAASEALTWNGSPRPDVIVGVDPFEAGLAARLIAKRFDRPLQYHIETDIFDPSFKLANPDNPWRLRIANYLLKRADSVRTNTRNLRDALQKSYRRIKDVSVMPRFHNFAHILSDPPTFDLHERLTGFTFIILAFGPLSADSYLHELFSALNRLLHNPRIGLLVVGDGPAPQLFLDKVNLLGIAKNVVFEKKASDLVSYLKTADLMIEIDPKDEGEVRVLQAAAAGLPTVMYATALRRDLFVDGVSAFVCDPGDAECLTTKTAKFINTSAMRKQVAEAAKDIAKERLHEDPAAHYQAMALAIESVLVSSHG
jgi:glycosyltransferase involved in cell wall biosynthesis